MRQCACALAIVATVAAQAPAPLRTLARGRDSRITAHHELVARTAARWQLIWHEHTGSSAAPDVDFSPDMVIGVFGGSGGPDASIEIVGVTREGGSVVVRYREQRSPVDRMSRTATIAPFHIVVVPANRVPVRFVVVTSPPDDLAGHARHDAVQRAAPTTC